MKKILVMFLAVAVCALFLPCTSHAIGKSYQKKSAVTKTYQDPAQKDEAESTKAPEKEKGAKIEFPDKGWHKGFYLAANVGMMQATNDKHVVTTKSFDGTFDMAFGLTFGWDIADWIGPMLQMNFGTATGKAGDANNNVPQQYNLDPGETYPANTFPEEDARSYTADIGLFARATLPYFTRAAWQPKIVKILPYLKIGGAGHAIYVNASTAVDKVGAFGGGPAFGGGCEFFIWKGFFVALDATETLVFQKSISRNISYTDANGVTQTRSQNLTDGGMHPVFSFYGIFGWHF